MVSIVRANGSSGPGLIYLVIIDTVDPLLGLVVGVKLSYVNN